LFDIDFIILRRRSNNLKYWLLIIRIIAMEDIAGDVKQYCFVTGRSDKPLIWNKGYLANFTLIIFINT